jgi:outer membrane protein
MTPPRPLLRFALFFGLLTGLLDAVLLINIVEPICWAQKEGVNSPVEPIYTIDDLYRSALEQAEQIQFAEKAVDIAQFDHELALSVIIPKLKTFADYTRYSQDKASISGALIQPDWLADWGVKLTQEFTVNGRELTALRIAEDRITKSKYDLNTIKEAYLLSVASAYYDVWKAVRTFDIAEADVRRLKEHRKAVLARLKLEEVTKTALFRAEAELSRAQADRVEAKARLRFVRTVLGRIVGLPSDIVLAKPPEKISGALPETPEKIKTRALDQRFDMKALRNEVDIAQKEIKYSRGAFWPTISLEGAYVSRDQNPFSEFIGRDSLYIMGTLNFTLYDGGLRTAKVHQARTRHRQAQLLASDLAKTISIEVERAYVELLARHYTLDALTDQLRFAEENNTAVTKQFNNGLSNIIDVIDANTLLVRAQLELADAQFDYQLAHLKLERAEGVFLTTVLIRLKPNQIGNQSQ